MTAHWPKTRYIVYKGGCEPRVVSEGSSFKVHNDGLADCPKMRLAADGDVVVDVDVIKRRSSTTVIKYKNEKRKKYKNEKIYKNEKRKNIKK